MSALLALVPIKDWIYVAIIGAILIGGYVFVHRCHAAEHSLQSIYAESKVALTNAEARIKALTDQHATEVHANEVIYERELADNATQHTADLVRLRQLEAYRQGHPEVGSAGSGPEAGTEGGLGVQQGAGSFSGLGYVAASLADATRDLSVALDACARDRNALTGK